MDWEDAMAEARREMGYCEDEYVSDWDDLVERAHDIQDYATEEMQDDYQDYLKTPHWKNTREAVLKRDKNKCVDCGNVAEQVHHESYDNVHTDCEYEDGCVDEVEINDCVSLCANCHRNRHCLN